MKTFLQLTYEIQDVKDEAQTRFTSPHAHVVRMPGTHQGASRERKAPDTGVRRETVRKVHDTGAQRGWRDEPVTAT